MENIYGTILPQCANVEFKVSFPLWLHELKEKNLKVEGFGQVSKLGMLSLHECAPVFDIIFLKNIWK